MPDSGSGDRVPASVGGGDLAALPGALATQSLSPTAIILPLDEALEALEHLTRAGRRLDQWEGWVRMPDGARVKSLAHAGSFSLPRDAERAAETAAAAMRNADAMWQRMPEYPGASLYFGLTFTSA